MTGRLNRRHFLRISAAAAAGGVVVACAPSAPRVASNPTSPPTSQPAAPTTAPAAKPTTPALSVSGQAPTPVAPVATVASGPTYKEAPALAQLVKDGKLPPVAQRLPTSPRVVRVLEETGQFGGVWHRGFLGVTDFLNIGKLMEVRLVKWDAPDPSSLRVVPNMIEKWEQSSDASEFTFYLRKGLKWSDGVEMTADDVNFWWEDMQNNKDLVPQPNLLIHMRVGDD
ncbi:MAG TPA: ABC transporter substrate-binding protein, partial [Chloroflexota bacterium]|nr:ABC transporter substrate-binding protein [Chloroflexota bacterium]